MLTEMLRHGRRLAVALVIVLSLGVPTSATGQRLAAKAPTTTTITIVKVEPVRIEEKRPPVDETSLLDAAIAGITALGGVAVGVRYTRKSEKDRATREQRNREIDDVARLVDRVTAVTNRLPTFSAGNANPDDVAELAADVRAVLDARDRVQDLAIRGSVEAFAAAAQEVVRDPKPGPVLSAQVEATATAAKVVKARTAQAIDALRGANTASRRARRAARKAAQE
jgi:hypothetical protein